MSGALRDVRAEARHRNRQTEALRRVLDDGRWHSNVELAASVGQRFGARLMEIRRGEDGGPPLDVVKERVNGEGSVWRYRSAGVRVQDELPLRSRDSIKRLRVELDGAIAALESANAELVSLGRKPYRAPSVITRIGVKP